ncbi:MAG: serine dehydratase subunit alpha family protein [Bacteroidales bacterium]|nr:serine dehydratase subunit alpha family protein [Bacteroidales bacterium]MBD5222847.1 serine dehydratase subunit alpha family protein [Bacteroidales bacterium]MBD5302155.1 serine dehydratase subunit alpha family protein [Bacteroides sp.]
MENTVNKRIINLINKEVVPAMGCTEPIAVALCVAKAVELLGDKPDDIQLRLSGNIIKNAMGVGIPGTGMIGLPIAVALGAVCGKSEYQLEVLRDVNEKAIEEGKKMISEGRIKILHHKTPPCNLHIEVDVKKGNDSATAVISGMHTNFVRLERNGVKMSADSGGQYDEANDDEDIRLNEKMVYNFAMTVPFEDIRFILEAGWMNRDAARLALKEDYGHGLGKVIKNQGLKFFGDTPIRHILSMTSAACDARMGGAQVSIMSNSGSGNQGITATLPVVCYAEDINATDEQLARALALSSLTSIYIKQNLGRLSALCGCVVASTGASAGLVHLMGGGYDEVCSAIKNMVANLTGMICDGAKPACAMKITSGVSTALMSALLAMNGKCVSSQEGIVSDDVDETISNLASIGREAMTETDHLVLDIMVNKG